MTILIGGAPTGLLDSSQTLLGRNDQTSTATTDKGDALFVNVASGNLLYAHQDAYLPSRGDDYSLLRTYNSRGAVTTGGAFNDARWGVSSTVSLSVIGTGTSTRYQVRYGEGSVFEYALDAATGKYISTDGAGAYETLEVLRDGAGALLGYTVVRADQTRLSFDAQGRLTRWEDTNGVFQSYTYGTAGITQVTDDAGHVLTYAYNTNGRLTSVTDEAGVVLVRYAYSGGRLATVTDRMGHVTKYFYYTDGYLQRIELPAAQTVGGVAQSFAARVISFEYQTLTGLGVPPAGARVLSRMVDAEGKATSFSYTFTLDVSGARTGAGTTTVTDALGKTMRYSYRADGAITQVLDQSNNATDYAYDAAGNLLSVSDRNGFGVVGSDSYYYRALRAELGYTDTTGAGKLIADLTAAEKTALKALFTARFSYDARGNVLTSTDNAGNTTTYTYTAFNKVATITTAEGGVTQFFYDTNVKQNLVKQVDPGGDVTRFTYDIYGNLKTRQVYLDRADAAKAPADVAADKKQVTTFFYDLHGNNIRTLDAEGVNAYGSYGHFGNLLSSTDGRGNKTLYTYDGDNRLVQLQDPTGRKTLFAYDAVGNRIGITTDWNGHTITQVFDKNNRLISTIHPAEDANAARTRTTTVGYDDVGNRTSVTDAEGRTTTYTYSARRELIEIKSAAVDDDGNATTAAVQYTRTLFYDFEGNTIWATDARGNATGYQYTRDGLLRLQTMADGQITQYSYDRNQNLLSVVAGLQLELSKRQTTTYAYDAENQIIRVTDAKGGVTAYAYDAPGNMAEMTDAAGRVSRLQYDRNNRLRFEVSAAVGVFDAATGAAVIDPATGLQQTVSYTVEHRFDADGNEIETIDQNGKSTLYAFDTVNRTTSMTDANGITTAYTYDGNDNILAITITAAAATSPSQVSSYQYDEFDQLIAATDGVGNALVASDTALYQNLRKELGYTVTVSGVTRGKLVAELTDAEKTALLAAFTERYTYDKVGNRKTATDHLGRSTGYEYDAFNRLVRVTNASTAADYATGVNAGFNQRSLRYDGNGNRVLSIDERGNRSEYTYDAQNRLQGSVDARGVRSSYSYDAFGNLKSKTLADGSPVARVTDYEYDLLNRLSAEIARSASGDQRTEISYDAVGNRMSLRDARGKTSNWGYDALNRVVSMRDALGFETQMRYDGVGNTIRIIDPRGGAVQLRFDAGNRQIGFTDARGRVTSFSYDALDNRVEQITAVGAGGVGSQGEEITRYEYDAENNLRAVVVLNGAVEERTETGFDRMYNVTRLTDARGNTQTIRYDALDRAVELTDALGSRTTFAYDPSGNLLRRTEAPAPGTGGVAAGTVVRETRWVYDATNRMLSETDATGTRTDYSYDVHGAVASITRAANVAGKAQTDRFEYDSFGNVKTAYDAANNPTTYTYDAANNVVAKVVENGTVDERTTYAYNDANRLISETRWLSATSSTSTRYAYDANGNLTFTQDAEGRNTVWCYNAANELILQIDALGYVNDYSYDANGNRATEKRYAASIGAPLATFDAIDRGVFQIGVPILTGTLGGDRLTRYQYDAQNRLLLVSDDVGDIVAYEYDAAANRTAVIDARGFRTEYGYDAQNRLISTIHPDASQETREYDALGNLIASTDRNGNRVTLTYNRLNRLSSVTDALGNVVKTLEYDRLGNVTGERDARGNWTHFTYGPLNRVSRRSNADATFVTYTYDKVGNLKTVTDERLAKTTYTYDALNRLSYLLDGENRRTDFGYDKVDNQISKTELAVPGATGVPANYLTTYTYDRLDHLTREQGGDAEYRSFGYNAFGDVTSEDAYGLVNTRSYDLRGRVVTAVDEVGNTQTRDYDAAGNVISRTDARGNTTTFVYDDSNRLLSASYGSGLGATTQTYDAAGNVLSITSPEGGTRYFAYDAAKRLVRSLSEAGYLTVYEYDVAGNETVRREYNGVYTLAADASVPLVLPGDTARVRQSTWNAMNQLATRTDSDGLIITYSYDAAGNLAGSMTRTVSTADRSGGTLGYDSNAMVIRQVDAAGVVTTFTLNAAGNVLVKVEAVGTANARTSTYTYDQGGTRLRSETTAAGRLTRYEYEGGSDRLTHKTVEDAADATHTILREERWSYYANGELQLYVNAVGMRAVYTWEGGLTKSITYAEGTASAYTVTYSYDARNRLVQEDSGVLFSGQMVSTRYEYDDNGNKTATVQAAGIAGQERITRYAYDAQSRLIRITDPEGKSTRYGYDSAGDQVWILDAKGTVTITRKNAQGLVSERVVGKASLTAGGDPVLSGGLPVITSANGGVRTTYTYDAANPALVASETTGFVSAGAPLNAMHTTRYTYDVLGRQKTITDAEGFSSSFDYDDFGNLVRLTVGEYVLPPEVLKTESEKLALTDGDPIPQPLQGNTWSYAGATWTFLGQYWTNLGALTPEQRSKFDRSTPQTTTFSYDAANNLIYTVDAEGGAIRSTYDVLGNRRTQITGIADSNAANYPELRLTTTYLWYADGTLKEQSNDAGERTVIARDVLGRQTSVRTLQSVTGGVEAWTQTGYVYDKAGRVIQEIPADNPFGTLFYYDAAGNLIREVVSTEDLDRTRSYRYDLMGRLVWSSGSVGNRAVGSGSGGYASYGNLYSFSGSATTYAYDAVGNLIKTEDAKGGVMRFYYNEYNQLIAKVDAEGGYTTYVRDAFGNELETYARPNKVTGTLLDLVPPSTSNQGPTERRSFRTYDGNNRVLTETSNQVINYGNGTTRAWLYDSTGLLLRLTETPAGSSTSLINTVTASGAGKVQSWSYDRTGRIRSFTAADGVVESYRYDAAGNKIEERVHNPALLANGLAAPLNSDPDRLTTYTYLSNGWLRTQTTGRNVQTLGYDRAGNVISKTDARNNTSTTRYDLMNRAISTVDASGKETRYAYDIFGNLTRVIDVRVSEGSSPVTTEAVKEFWYDLDGRVVLEVRPAFETWSLPLTVSAVSLASPDALEKGLVFKTYDAVGNLIRITDERGFVTRNWYDLLGRKVAERNGDGALRTFIYNVFGDVTSTTLDRTARSTLDVSDAAPLPVVAVADAITMRYEYDAKGRLTTTTWPQVTVTTLTDTDTATAVGAPTVSQSSSKLSTRTTYDAWGNVVSVPDANRATTYSYYDINGRVVAQVDATGYLTSFAYDSQGHLVRELKYKTALAAGSFSTVLKPTGSASDIGYQINRVYDAENNLVQETGPSVQTVNGLRRMTTYFSYDAAGNLIAKRVGDITTQDKEQIQEYYFYDALNRLVASVATNRVLTTFTYDRNGNLKEQRRYFNPLTAAQLATRTDPALAATAGTVLPVASAAADQLKTFFYNAVNLLVRETELAASAGGIDITRVYGYDRSGHRSYAREGDLAADGTLLPAGTALIVGNPALRQSFYTYDAAGRQTVASEAKHYNQKHFTTYNTAGQIVKAWYTPAYQGSPAQTKVEEYRYNDAGFLVATNAGNGLWRAFDVDAMGRALRTRLYGSLDAFNNQGLAANAPLLSYDFFDKTGSVTKHIDEIGARYASERDYAGRLITKIEPGRLQTDQSITRYAYDGAGNRVTETDAESRTTQYRYDRLGNMTRKTWPAGNAQVWVYDIAGTAFYDNELSGTYFIEANGTEVIGTRESYSVDSFGRRLNSYVGSANLGGGVITYYKYDRHDRLLNKTTAGETESGFDDATATYLYDTFDNQVGVQDENRHFFLRAFNAAGLQVEYSFRGVVAGDGSETFVQAKPTTLAAALAAVRSGHPNLVEAFWSTNYLGFIEVRPSNGSSPTNLNLVFDDFGRVLEETLAGGVDVTYTYDRFGRRVTRSTALPGLDQAYGYDAAGRLIWTLDIPQSTLDGYSLDYAGNVITEHMVSNATSSVLASGQVLYTPKSGGYASLTRTFSSYNKNNELVRWDELDSAGNSIYWEIFGYDGNGRHITWYTQTKPTNYTNTASFDGANRLLRSIDGAVFTYGANGNRASMSSSATGLLVYGYYADGKVKEARRDSPTGGVLESWSYDKAGNITRYYREYTSTLTYTLYDSSNTRIYSKVLDTFPDTETETRFLLWRETGAIREIGVVVTTMSTGSVTANLRYQYEQGPTYLSIYMSGASTGVATSDVRITTDGRTRKVIDVTEPTKEFLYDARGNIVQKREYVITSYSAVENQTRFLCAAGKPVAERFRSGSNPLGVVITNWSAWADTGSGDIMAHEPIDASYPQSSELQHTVIAGETLRSLATQYYGTPDLWFVIAEENGLTGSEMLSAGARMVVPGTTDNNYRNAENYSVYKPGDIVGSVLPGIPPAQTASDDSCLLQGAIITLIVVIAIAAIAATILTAGALAPVFAAGAAAAAGTGSGVIAGVVVASTAAGVAAIAVGVAASVVAGVVIAAAASALIQASLIGFGVQKEFDVDQFKGDLVAGALGGLAAGVGSAVSTIAVLSRTAQIVAVVAVAALEAGAEAAGQAVTGRGTINPENAWMIGAAGAGGLLGGVGDVYSRSAKAAKVAAMAAKKIDDVVDAGEAGDKALRLVGLLSTGKLGNSAKTWADGKLAKLDDLRGGDVLQQKIEKNIYKANGKNWFGVDTVGNNINGVGGSKLDRLLGLNSPQTADFKDPSLIIEKNAIFSPKRLRQLNKEAVVAERAGNAAMATARQAAAAAVDKAAAAATRSRLLQRAADVEMFSDQAAALSSPVKRRILADSEVGPLLTRKAQEAFDDENLLFVGAVKGFRDATPAQKLNLAGEIMTTFIKPNAPTQINLQASTLKNVIKNFDAKIREGSFGATDEIFDETEDEILRLMERNSAFRATQKSPEVASLRARLSAETTSMLRSPLDRLAAASPNVRSKSAQNALSPGYFRDQNAARETAARLDGAAGLNNVENASSPGDQFYAAWDNPQLQESIRETSTVFGKFADENFGFALAARDYQRARLAQDATGVNDAVARLSERIAKPYSGLDQSVEAKDTVLEVNMNGDAEKLFRKVLKENDYQTLDRILPVTVSRLLRKEAQGIGRGFGKFLAERNFSPAPPVLESDEVNKMLGTFGQ